MRTQAKATKLAQALAASADPSRNDNVAERETAFAKLVQLCFVHGFELSTFAPYYQPEPEATEQPASEAPNASATKRAARVAMLRASRELAARYYDGASLAAHKTVPPTYNECVARVCDPVQRAKSLSERDESGLALALSRTDDDGAFDPVAAGFDIGILSRLASLGHIDYTPAGTFVLTTSGLGLARGVVNRKRS